MSFVVPRSCLAEAVQGGTMNVSHSNDEIACIVRGLVQYTLPKSHWTHNTHFAAALCFLHHSSYEKTLCLLRDSSL